MTAPTPRLVGTEEVSGRRLYVSVVDDVRSWAEQIEESVRGFVVLTAVDSSGLASDELYAFAKRVLDEDCRYACAWGSGASAMETAFDYVYVNAEIAGTPYPEFVVTTSHEDESLDEALWFAVFVAYPDSEVSNVLVITQSEWADHVERRLSDTASLIRDVVEADDQS